MASNHQDNAPVAFAVCSFAGMATSLGAAVVFFPTYIKYANRIALAGALGLSAGVMVYVSFVEIFSKSVKSFVEGGFSDSEAYQYATCCFFAGVSLMVGLNLLVTSFLKVHHNHYHPSPQTCLETSAESTNKNESQQRPTIDDSAAVAAVSPCACCSDDPVGDLDRIQRMAADIEHGRLARDSVTRSTEAAEAGLDNDDKEVASERDNMLRALPAKEEEKEMDERYSDCDDDDRAISGESGDANHDGTTSDEESKKILSMSINTAIAIGLHNFPEGLATFIATLNEPKVGIVLGVAIAIHNIPEGLCVALPIYYATGNRRKAFLLALLSGASEPFAALLGWAVLAGSFSPLSFAILFGLVAGMMVIISVRELLPTAHRYDPDDKVVTYFFMAGMAIMALSLVLFTL